MSGLSGGPVGLGALLLTLAIAGDTAVAQTDEYGVKAAFVRNVLSFVVWPPDRLQPSTPLVVCVVNESPLTPRLTAMAVHAVRDHPVQVRTVVSVTELDACHAAFMPAGEMWRMDAVVRHFADRGLLTIGEGDGSTRTGAVIDVFVAKSRVAFEVDLAAARAGGLQVSSKLLTLARRVHGESARAVNDAAAAPAAERGR